MNTIWDHMTPSRLDFLSKLAELGVGEPHVRGTARNHCLKLGWIEGVYHLEDGRQITSSKYDEMVPPGPDKWRGVKFAGVTLTEKGRDKLRGACGEQWNGE